MQNINLSNMLLQLAGKTGQAATPDATINSSKLSVTPVVVNVNGAVATISSANGRNLATVASQMLGDVPIDSAIRSSDGKALWTFSAPQNLFSTILSAQQQQTLIAALARQPLAAQALTNSSDPIQLTNAIVKSIAGQQVTLTLQPPLPQLREVTIDSPKAAKTLEIGQKVQVQVQQIGRQWTATLLTPESQRPSAQKQTTDSTSTVTPTPKAALAPIKIAIPTEHPLIVKTLQQVIPQSNGAPVTPSLLPVVKSLLPQATAELIDKSIKSGAVNANFHVDKNNKLTINAVVPLLKIPVTVSGGDQPVQAGVNNLNKISASVERPLQAFVNLPKAQQQLVWQALSIQPQSQPPRTSPVDIQTKHSQSVVAAQNNTSSQPSNAAPQVNFRDTTSALSDAVKQQLQHAIKHHFVQAEPASKVAVNITQAVAALSQSPEPDLKALAEKIAPVIKPAVVAEPSTTALQQVLQTPAVPISPQAVSRPAPANSMISGLITLLQISLATRLPTTNALSTGDKVNQILSTLTQVNQVAGKEAPSRSSPRARAQEVTGIEQRHSLLRSLTQALSGHQFSKMAQAENTTQGQDTLFYALPGIAGPTGKDIELLIQRESPEKDNHQPASGERSHWRLTMLLDIGEQGEVLCKCELQESELGLDLYTSNEALKVTVLEFLPKLKQRMTAFGLEIVHSHCQLGAIPSSLRPKPYQLLHTQA